MKNSMHGLKTKISKYNKKYPSSEYERYLYKTYKNDVRKEDIDELEKIGVQIDRKNKKACYVAYIENKEPEEIISIFNKRLKSILSFFDSSFFETIYNNKKNDCHLVSKVCELIPCVSYMINDRFRNKNKSNVKDIISLIKNSKLSKNDILNISKALSSK